MTDTVRVFEEEDAITKLFDDIIITLRDEENKELLIFGLDEKQFADAYPQDKLLEHIAQRKKLGVEQKLLLCEGDDNFIDSPDIYRWVPEEYFYTTPTYVYGDKVATILLEQPAKVFIVKNKMFSTERRRNFYMAWDAAIAPKRAES